MRTLLGRHGAAVISLSLFLAAQGATGCGDSSSDDSDGGGAGGATGARIYVTVAGDNEVLVIDDASHEVVSHIPVGQGPAILLATPDHEKLYAADWQSNDVTAIDVATEKPTRIPMNARPYVIATAPDGKHVYAGLNSNAIAVIDTKTDAIAKTFKTDALPASIVVSTDGETLYVATVGVGPGTLRRYSASTGEVIGEAIQVGSAPAWITISPDGKKVYTLNFLSDDVTVVDTATFEIDTTIKTGAGTQGIIGSVTPDNAALYVTNYGSGDMVAIDTKTNTITRTIELGGRPVGVSFDEAGKRVYAADFGPASLDGPADTSFLLTGKFTTKGNGEVSVFDVATGKAVGKPIATGPGATSVVVLP